MSGERIIRGSQCPRCRRRRRVVLWLWFNWFWFVPHGWGTPVLHGWGRGCPTGGVPLRYVSWVNQDVRVALTCGFTALDLQQPAVNEIGRRASNGVARTAHKFREGFHARPAARIVALCVTLKHDPQPECLVGEGGVPGDADRHPGKLRLALPANANGRGLRHSAAVLSLGVGNYGGVRYARPRPRALAACRHPDHSTSNTTSSPGSSSSTA